MKIIATAGELADRGLWVKAARVTGHSRWAIEDCKLDRDSEIALTEHQARQIGLLPAAPADDREPPHRIDPAGCNCTDCGAGCSVPLDAASDGHVLAMLAGGIQDATGERFTRTTTQERRNGAWETTEVIVTAEHLCRHYTQYREGRNDNGH